MSNALIIVTIGTIALASIALMLFVIARTHHTYGRYGREALAVAGALLVSYIPVRLLLYTDHIDSKLALQINSISAITAAVILGEAIALRRTEIRHNGNSFTTKEGAP